MNNYYLFIFISLFNYSGSQHCNDMIVEDCGDSFCEKIWVEDITNKENCQKACVHVNEGFFDCESFRFNSITNVRC